MTFSPFDLRTKNLFKRCVQCDPLTSAACPACKSDEVCTLIPISCDRCPEYQCQSAAESGAVDIKPTPTAAQHSPAPAIAGGVIGGVVLIALITFLIWRFALKGKRHDPVEEWDPMDYPMEKPGEMRTLSREARSRASTHTVTSMASTVLTRASNVIQIAFIPGVTTRQQQQGNAETPHTLVPPVPPIPIPTNRESDADLIFMPGDLRDSAYTDVSAFDARKSLAPSLARTSIASTIYKENAVAVAPIKPSLVSVSKATSPASTPGLRTPPVPSIDMKRFGPASVSMQKPMLVQMPVSRETNGESVGRSPIGSVRGLKPKAVTISKGKTVANNSDSTSSSPTLLDSSSSHASTPDKRPFPSSPLAHSGRVQSQTSEADSAHVRAKRGMDESDDSEDDSSPHERSRKSLMRKESSPFSDSAAVESRSISSLNSAKERANTESPFDDRNRL